MTEKNGDDGWGAPLDIVPRDVRAERERIQQAVMELTPDEFGRVSKGLVLAIVRDELAWRGSW